MKTTMLILASTLAFIPALTGDSLPTSGALPDLCDDVYLDADGVPIHDSTGMTLSRYCEWTGPHAPIWGGSAHLAFAITAHCER